MIKGSNVEKKDHLSISLKDLHDEVWGEIPGYGERYLISQYSRVKSLMKKNPRILRQSFSSGKYKVVLIGKYGRLITEDVGRLCAKVHKRLPEENEVIEYCDGDKLNNAADNLRWITRTESRKKTLLRCRLYNIKLNSGEANGRAVINSQKAKEIREQKNRGLSYGQIAAIHNISRSIVQRVVKNENWKNV